MQSFPVGDIGIDNATLGSLVSPTEENDFYYFPVNLSDDGLISAEILAGVATDYAGNDNTAANAGATFTFNYDDIHPTLVITAYHGGNEANALTQGSFYKAVSYTHLTQPTSDLV